MLSANLYVRLVRMLDAMERLVIEEKSNNQTDILEQQLQSASAVMVGCCWTNLFKETSNVGAFIRTLKCFS